MNMFTANTSLFASLCLKLLNLVLVSQYKLNSKKIMLFTNTDNPHAGSQHKQHQARIKAADLGQLDIDVELLHMGSNFDPSLFYKVSEYVSTVLMLYIFLEIVLLPTDCITNFTYSHVYRRLLQNASAVCYSCLQGALIYKRYAWN